MKFALLNYVCLRIFQYFFLIGYFSLSSQLNAQHDLAKSDINKPNFLFVLVDDQPFDAVGFSGRYPFLETPNIDRLHKEGAHVENSNTIE